MELELKHLAPYLPYNLMIKYRVGKLSGYKYDFLTGQRLDSLSMYKYFKPILRPLSDLTKEIEVNGEKFVPQDKLPHLDLKWLINSDNLIMKTNYEDVLKLLSWHIDLFNLISNGLAIDANTLNQ